MIRRSENGKPCLVQGFLLTTVIALAVGCGAPKSDLMVLQGKAQGTTFTIKYLDSLQRDLSGPVDSILKVIDHSMSLWDSASTVTGFNASRDSFVSEDVHFRTVVSLSQNLWNTTNRTFDPTVLPVVKAWGLGKAGRSSLDTTSVMLLCPLVGMDRIRIDEDWRLRSGSNPPVTYHKAARGGQFDPNGIAQGYTVDLIALFLQRQGIDHYMVEVGGEVRAMGTNEKGTPWMMQIDKPVEGHVQQTVVPLADKSLATSGNYRKFIEIAGKRYGHTIDPRSCRPALNALLSASVIADDCATADALGTALMVMGPEEGKVWLAQHPEVDAYLTIDDGKGNYVPWQTPGWPIVGP